MRAAPPGNGVGSPPVTSRLSRIRAVSLTCRSAASRAALMSPALLAALAASVAALESVDAAARVDQLLLARIEGMALAAKFDVHVALRRAGRERVAARAPHLGHDVVG